MTGAVALPQVMTGAVALPQVMTGAVALPQSMTGAVALPQTLKGEVILSQTITSKCKEIEFELENINNQIKNKCKELEIEIENINNQLKTKLPHIKGSGDYICEDTIHSFDYQGEGLVGIHNAMKVQFNMLKHMIKEVCFIADEFDDDVIGNITIPKCDPNDTLPGIKKMFITQTSNNDTLDNNDDTLPNLFDDTLPGNVNQIAFKGKGIKGLNNQVNAVLAVNQIITTEICKHKGTGSAYPVFADPHLEEFPINRQLTITFVEIDKYPYQEGSHWHRTIPMPKSDLTWEDFDDFIFFTGTVYGRIIWEASKVWSGGYFRDDAEAARVLEKMESLSTISRSGEYRIGKGGKPKKPTVRQLRAVRAVVADLNPETGDPETVLTYTPPNR